MDMSGLNKIMMMMLSILSKTARSNGFLDEIIACCRGDVTAANKTNPVSLLLLMDYAKSTGEHYGATKAA
ncbi:hypothetical protein NP908_004481 [Escherichia coli]|nr:hypothetical protein [Escherichia coli]